MQIAEAAAEISAVEEAEQPALTVQQAQVMPRIDPKARLPQRKKRRCSGPKADCKLPVIRRNSTPAPTFTYAVKKGNNSRLILSTLRKRPWMYGVPVEQHEGVDFYWASHLERSKLNTHSRKGDKVLLNHVQYNGALSTKKGLYFNLRKWCEQSGVPLATIVPKTFYLSCDPTAADDEKAAFLAYNAAHAASGSGSGTPETTRSSISSVATSNAETSDDASASTNELIWIMKPATSTNRGYGISVVPNASQVIATLEKASKYDKYGWIVQQYIERPLLVRGRKFDIRCFVLVLFGEPSYTRKVISQQQQSPQLQPQPTDTSTQQQAIETQQIDTEAHSGAPVNESGSERESGKPQTRKRASGTTKGTKDVVAYFYEDGYIRTSGTKYKTGKRHLADRMIHLTNDAVQKKDKNYGKYETGNKLTYDELQSCIDTAYPNQRNGVVHQHILPTMKAQTRFSIEATAEEFKASRHAPAFELFGYDFMITEGFDVHLIEVNSNPCLEFACEMLERLLVDMMDDTFKLAVDSLFLPSEANQSMTRSCAEAIARLQKQPHKYQQIYPSP